MLAAETLVKDSRNATLLRTNGFAWIVDVYTLGEVDRCRFLFAIPLRFRRFFLALDVL